jgi:hypothetical protein
MDEVDEEDDDDDEDEDEDEQLGKINDNEEGSPLLQLRDEGDTEAEASCIRFIELTS